MRSTVVGFRPLLVIFVASFALSGCQYVDQILGIIQGSGAAVVTISGTVSVDTSVQASTGASVWVGITDTAPFAAPSDPSRWIKSTSYTISPGQQHSFSFSNVTPGQYVIVAFYDANNNGVFDSGEAAGSYPSISAGGLFDFSSDHTGTTLTVMSVSTGGGSGGGTLGVTAQ